MSPIAIGVNAVAERFVRSVRRECLDWFIIVGERQLRKLLEEYVYYYNEQRPHQGIGQEGRKARKGNRAGRARQRGRGGKGGKLSVLETAICRGGRERTISSDLGRHDLALIAMNLSKGEGGNVLEYERLTGRIIGAGVQVHRELGPGFLESIYEGALVVEPQNRVIPFERQLRIPVIYKNTKVGAHRLDLVVADKVVIEIKPFANSRARFLEWSDPTCAQPN